MLCLGHTRAHPAKFTTYFPLILIFLLFHILQLEDFLFAKDVLFAEMPSGPLLSLHTKFIKTSTLPSSLFFQLTGSEERFPSLHLALIFALYFHFTKPPPLMHIHNVNNSLEIYICLLFIYLLCVCRVYFINQENSNTLSHQVGMENSPL